MSVASVAVNETQATVLAALDNGRWQTVRQLAQAVALGTEPVRQALESLYTRGHVLRREMQPGSARWEWRVAAELATQHRLGPTGHGSVRL